MSMAVVDDTPEQEDAGSPVAPKPTFGEILSLHLRLRGRQLWRAIVIPIRSIFFLEEDSMRDQMIMGLRADVDVLANRLAHAMQGVNLLNERLSAHEEAIPRMRAIKAQIDNTKRIEKEERERAAAKARDEAAEEAQRLQDGVLV